MLEQKNSKQSHIEYNTYSTTLEIIPDRTDITNSSLVLSLARTHRFQLASDTSIQLEKEIVNREKIYTLVVTSRPKDHETISDIPSDNIWRATVYEKRGKGESINSAVLAHLPVIEGVLGKLFKIVDSSISTRQST